MSNSVDAWLSLLISDRAFVGARPKVNAHLETRRVISLTAAGLSVALFMGMQTGRLGGRRVLCIGLSVNRSTHESIRAICDCSGNASSTL